MHHISVTRRTWWLILRGFEVLISTTKLWNMSQTGLREPCKKYVKMSKIIRCGIRVDLSQGMCVL